MPRSTAATSSYASNASTPRNASSSGRSAAAAEEERRVFRALPSVVTWAAGHVAGSAHVREGEEAGAAPREWYGKHELAKSVYVEGDSDDDQPEGEVGETGMRVSQVDAEFEEQWQRVQATRERVLAEHALGQAQQAERTEAPQEAEEDGLPELEDVDVEAIELQLQDGKGLWGEEEEEAKGGAKEEEEEEAVVGVVRKTVETQYAKDNAGTNGEYNREMESRGAYDARVSSKAQEVPKEAEGLRGGAESAAAEQEAAEVVSGGASFFPAQKFMGRREGFVFKMGEEGLGYYADAASGGGAAEAEEKVEEKGEAEEEEGGAGYQDGDMDALD